MNSRLPFYPPVRLAFAVIMSLAMAACGKSAEKNQKSIAHKSDKMKGYTTNIEKSTLENKNFRKVLYTAKHMQLVLMSLKPKEEIGAEVHPGTDQFFRIESGHGICIINDNTYNISDGDVVIVPAGTKHNIINTDSESELKLYTIYTPPEHQDGIIRATKSEAETNKEEFDGKTTE